jgi:hypothetical protein
MARLYWLSSWKNHFSQSRKWGNHFSLRPRAFARKKLFHAKPQSRKGTVFFFAPLRLGEKKSFHAKPRSRKGGYSICGKSDRMVIAAFSIPQAVIPGIVGRMFIRPYTWNWGMDGPGRLSESGFSGFSGFWDDQDYWR